MKVLITGGAGFIGSHLADRLLESGHAVRILDNLSPQVHGPVSDPPSYLNRDAEFRHGDIRDPEIVRKALSRVDAVFHFAASVGVGQSMYEVEKYTSVNNLGTAVLLQALIDKPVGKLVVASSMSIYGEGLYRSANGTLVSDAFRDHERLKEGFWDPAVADGSPLEPVPTPETKTPSLESVYALSKFDQERLTLLVSKAYGIPAVALRFFNVYGTRQALSNPYTGMLAIFASRLLNGKSPVIFEDGKQKRDFVSVHDVVSACVLALEKPQADGGVFNVGCGSSFTIESVAEKTASALGKDIRPVLSGKYRVGDIRHCFADISRAREVLGYEPRVGLEEGLAELASWLGTQIALDRVEDAHLELENRGLRL